MPYRVILGRRAEKNLRALRADERARVKDALLVLEEDPIHPRPGADIKRLKGTRRLYRVRVGPWRAIYGIHDGDVIITDFFRKKRGYDI
ncbi:MAG: type II toxin-antitoxin system RelE/ParE family toxin [Euryarchaeota archaeon]|nr:type II toxin-antitoxin system RelE/ParE family toxin [Euryarchaeota archaeon]